METRISKSKNIQNNKNINRGLDRNIVKNKTNTIPILTNEECSAIFSARTRILNVATKRKHMSIYQKNAQLSWMTRMKEKLKQTYLKQK